MTQFVAKHESTGNRIKEALESGDSNQAERLAHSLKGVAGNLGINRIFVLAGNLEKAIGESRADVQVQLREFTSELDRQVQAIQRALKVEPPVEQRREGSRKMDPAEALELVARLRALLQASDADAATAYARLKDVVRGTADEAKWTRSGRPLACLILT